eukprot:TRINITY_DN3185_c0_g1_i1.p1 TRINITY_DN3185_c0_g1~~TRINITY_DN3185_c0_g1_i1.p1  ORF type:complete len:450 (+),score=99.33 TRINITY_DN3185_c0_g1_i1:147-1496(+)
MVAYVLRLAWRWSQLAITISLMLFESTVRYIIEGILRVIPLNYFLEICGLSRKTETKRTTDEEEDYERTTTEYIKSRGYLAEEHYVTTPDGYVLCLHRVTGRKYQNGANESDEEEEYEEVVPPKKGVVFLMHGFMQNSEAFTIRKNTHDSLPLLLSDAGYDVWLGNNRGNKYSYKHVTKKPNSEDFWDFCLDEMIRYDIPCMIDHALAVSGAEKLSYIGFSQGTAQGFGCFSVNHYIANKVNLFVALAPVSQCKGFSNPMVHNLITSHPDFIFLLFGKRKIMPFILFWRRLLSPEQFARSIDMSIMFLFGWTASCLDPDEKALLYSHIFSFASVKTVVHWFQMIQCGRFQMYDDTAPQREGKYSGYEVSKYDLTHIGCPVALFHGGRDHLPNTTATISIIPKDKLVYNHREEEYEHLDFMWAKNASQKIFPKIITLLDRFSAPSKKSFK